MIRKSVFVLTLLILAFTGCKKQKEKNIQPSKDFSLITNDISSIVPLVLHLAQSEEYLRTVLAIGDDSLNTSAIISLVSGDTLNVSNSSPLVFDIDYSSGVIDMDGIYKKGVVRCEIRGFMTSSGATCSCSFRDFEIGENPLTGAISITNTGALSHLITTSNLKLKVAKKHIDFDADMRVIQLEGNKTLTNLLDDSFYISSTSIIVDRYGKEFDVFAEEILKKYSCKWLSGGYAELNDDKNKVQVIDFGDGVCDNEAVVTIEDEVYTIDLE